MRFLLLLTVFLLFTGCSTRTAKHSKTSSYKTTHSNKSYHEEIVYEDLDKLYPYHNKWHQTPYKLGGFGSNGIDCSAFVQRVYKDNFNLTIPRTTRALSTYGKKVSRSSIKTGDIIFFKTGYNTRHVGVYLQHGDFMHASSSEGVIISNIDNPYWKKHYWMTRRIK